LAYISDHQAPADLTTVDKQVLELCEQADLVIHDSQYTEEEFAAVAGWGHSTEGYAVQVATEAGARALGLFHYDPSHTDAEIDTMLERARHRAAGEGPLEVLAASEGASIDMGRA
jgi:ribonuclease BN (tRNA processing enzyme)